MNKLFLMYFHEQFHLNLSISLRAVEIEILEDFPIKIFQPLVK